MMLGSSDFAAFFEGTHGFPPFPWQVALAERVSGGNWPRCIALPTAAGKTACIDIAVFALALQAARPFGERTSPRRVFFVVDRRIVVDQACQHATKLRDALATPINDVQKRVAEALRRLANGPRALDVFQLRGGMYREAAWARTPLQPTVITSTVDQVGSRLLFRGYGVSDGQKPVHAALLGIDSLIILDEAHCARPFEQTLDRVRDYRQYGEQQLAGPLQVVTMTATPGDTGSEGEIVCCASEDLAHPVLGRRLNASKRTRLVIAEKASGSRWRPELPKEMASQAESLLPTGAQAIGVVVNRVATARNTARILRERLKAKVDVILLTGRMRPIDRDRITKTLMPILANGDTSLRKPMIVVATQCIEVGADFDFHALVSECASMDALRQRFGRLNRVGARDDAPAVVVVRADQTTPAADPKKRDPVYGDSLAHTWMWLSAHSHDGEVDFGVTAINDLSAATDTESLRRLIAPSTDAAVLLPSHLDSWAQTSPTPAPDPDPAIFLHGPESGPPDVSVVFRDDLGEDPSLWADIVSLRPPVSSEALPVRIDIFRRWVNDEAAEDETSDIEGAASEVFAQWTSAEGPAVRRALHWLGARQATVISESTEVRPGGIYVIPLTSGGIDQLGDFLDSGPDDVADEAFQHAFDRAVLRLNGTSHSLSLEDFESADHANDITEALNELDEAEREKPPPERRDWFLAALASLRKPSHRIVHRHPVSGFVVVGKRRLNRFNPSVVEGEDSWESASIQPIELELHCRDVAKRAVNLASAVGLESFGETYRLAGRLHDAGKADPRFQAWLHGGNRRRADAFPMLLAKSIGAVLSRPERRLARLRAGYPDGARHEFLSLRLAEAISDLPATVERDLLLHLIGSHHGRCRPFADVVIDEQPELVSFSLDGAALAASSATRLERIDSGVAPRYWKLTRRFGWWGLAWLETLLRTADWMASEQASLARADESPVVEAVA